MGGCTFYQGLVGGMAGPYQGFPTSSSLTVGEWTHVVVTRSGSTVTWYLNGVQDSQFTSSVVAGRCRRCRC